MITENANRLGSFRSEPEYRGLLLDASKPSLYVLPGAEVKPSVKFDDATLVKDPCGYELSVTSPCVLFLCIEPVMLGDAPNITGYGTTGIFWLKDVQSGGALDTKQQKGDTKTYPSGYDIPLCIHLDASKSSSLYSGSNLQTYSVRTLAVIKT